jgi:hypothetical protein
LPYLIKLIIWFIELPFKLIGSLFRGNKKWVMKMVDQG